MSIVKTACYDEHFGVVIKQGRALYGFTQEKLAELVNVDLRTVQRWETEENIPWPSCIDRLVNAIPEIGESLRETVKKYIKSSFVVCIFV